MVAKKRPGEAFCRTFRQLGGKSGQKPFLIAIIGKNIAPLNAANNNVMEDIRYIETWLARHEGKVAQAGQGDNN